MVAGRWNRHPGMWPEVAKQSLYRALAQYQMLVQGPINSVYKKHEILSYNVSNWVDLG